MNPLKMHIRLRQQLRQVASNTLGDLEPDEIDDYLHQAQLLFLDRIIEPRNNKLQVGFEQSYQRFVEAGIEPTTIVRELGYLSADTMGASLPAFLHTLTRIDVSTEKCQAKYKLKEFKIAVIPFNVPHALVNFNSFVISAGNSQFTAPNFLNPENVDSVPYHLNNKTIDDVSIYWESVDRVYKPNCFIVKVAHNSILQNCTITYDGSNTETINFETVSYNVADLDTDGIYRGCNIAQQEDVSDMLIDPWQTTKHNRPLVEINGKHVVVHHNEKFVPKLVRIGYIPIPRPISYNLNVSCELPERTHQTIVALAAELIQQDMLGVQKQTESRI